MKIIPNLQQKEAIAKGVKWYLKQNKQKFEISGAAGTGKTTIVKIMIEELGLDPDEVLFVAYIGKATLALSRAGNRAQTIHSTIYSVEEVPVYDDDGRPKMHLGRPLTKPKFVKKNYIDKDIKLIVIDEAGMVPENIARDIMSFDVPIITLGDLNQLPPVFGASYFLRKPDSILTEPMRQALDSPIISLAQMILNNKAIPFGKIGKNCHIIRKSDIKDSMYKLFDITICGKNATRTKLNKYIRENVYKIVSDRPAIGDKMICRQNNWRIPPLDENIYLINGLIGYVEDVHLESFNGQSIDIDFRPEFLDFERFNRISIDYLHLKNPQDGAYRHVNKFEYAYAITCHLAQGSEYKNVLVLDEVLGDREYHKRWLYTAVTRAKEGLVVAL